MLYNMHKKSKESWRKMIGIRLFSKSIIASLLCASLCIISFAGCSFSISGTAQGEQSSDDTSAQFLHDHKTESEINEYGMISRSVITLKIGGSTEILDFDTFGNWIDLEPIDEGLYSYKANSEKFMEYASYLGKKYNTYEPYIDFTTSYGEKKMIENKSTGWILDEQYTSDQLQDLVMEGTEFTVDLTDRSSESDRWWVRIMGDYDRTEGYGNSYAEVSISEQYMWLFKNGKKILESSVITGNPNTGNDTPKGAFRVANKQTNALLYGPGYETRVDYWVGFAYEVGFHDASWQNSFGGNEYLINGSHGCVNLPTYVAEQVYENAYENMPVFVY